MSRDSGMNLQNGRGSVSTASSSGALKSGETVPPDQFLAGLRVDDPACLNILEKMLDTCLYEVRKKKNEWKDVEQSGSVDEGDRQQKPCEGTWKNSKKRKDEDKYAEDRDDTSLLKKPRVVWSVELHQQFVGAVNQLGIDKAAPKKILELLNVPGLTRENVASHLQKYRLYVRRSSGVSQHQSKLKLSSQQESFGAMSSLNGIDPQTLAATGQLPAQSLATLQAAGLGRSTTTSMPLVDQRNLFRFAEGQQHHSNGKPMNLLHSIPTTMEAKQLADLHQSAQSLWGCEYASQSPWNPKQLSIYDRSSTVERADHE